MIVRPQSFRFIAIVVCMIATAAPAGAKSATLSGTATWREKMAVPTGAVLDVKLEDVSGTGPPTLVAGVRINKPREVPIPFKMRYDPGHIVAAHMYAVHATLTLHGKPLFLTDPPVRALTHGYGNDVKIVMRRAPDSESASPPPGGSTGSEQALAYNRWVPVHIGDRTVSVEQGHQEPWIELDARTHKVTGSGGCNRFNGSYEAQGSTLRIGPLATTRMACPHMDNETAFLRALDETRSWRVHGRTLELMNDKGITLVRLEERNLH